MLLIICEAKRRPEKSAEVVFYRGQMARVTGGDLILGDRMQVER